MIGNAIHRKTKVGMKSDFFKTSVNIINGDDNALI